MKNTFLFILIFSWPVIASAIDQSKFKGYLVYDEEWIGFYRCGGEVYGLDGSGGLDISAMYQREKSGLRELLYVELLAEVTNQGLYTFGPSSPQKEKNLRIRKVIRTEHHESPKCRIASEATIITIYDESS